MQLLTLECPPFWGVVAALPSQLSGLVLTFPDYPVFNPDALSAGWRQWKKKEKWEKGSGQSNMTIASLPLPFSTHVASIALDWLLLLYSEVRSQKSLSCHLPAPYPVLQVAFPCHLHLVVNSSHHSFWETCLVMQWARKIKIKRSRRGICAFWAW